MSTVVPYDVLEIDLTTPRSRPFQILDRGIPIGDVAILQLPAVAVGLIKLRIGDRRAKPFPLRLEGQNFHVYQQRVDGGLYLDNPVGFPGVTLIIFVGIADYDLSSGVKP